MIKKALSPLGKIQKLEEESNTKIIASRQAKFKANTINIYIANVFLLHNVFLEH